MNLCHAFKRSILVMLSIVMLASTLVGCRIPSDAAPMPDAAQATQSALATQVAQLSTQNAYQATQISSLLDPTPSAPVGYFLLNGNLDEDNFGLIKNWAQTQIDLSRWYLVQDIPSGSGRENVRWIERVDLSQEDRGYGLKSTDYQNCDGFCSVEAVQIVPAVGNSTYRLSADARTEQGAGTSLYLDFLDANRNRIKVFTGGYSGIEWSTITVTNRSPQETKYIRIILYSSNSNQGIICWDNVQLSLIEE